MARLVGSLPVWSEFNFVPPMSIHLHRRMEHAIADRIQHVVDLLGDGLVLLPSVD
jgi:hypothetical protein